MTNQQVELEAQNIDQQITLFLNSKKEQELRDLLKGVESNFDVRYENNVKVVDNLTNCENTFSEFNAILSPMWNYWDGKCFCIAVEVMKHWGIEQNGESIQRNLMIKILSLYK